MEGKRQAQKWEGGTPTGAFFKRTQHKWWANVRRNVGKSEMGDAAQSSLPSHPHFAAINPIPFPFPSFEVSGHFSTLRGAEGHIRKGK
jgi:hypothetical protein